MQLAKLNLNINQHDYFDKAINHCVSPFYKTQIFDSIRSQELVSWICDFGNISSQIKLWKELFPKVQPTIPLQYSQLELLPLLNCLGIGFTGHCKKDLAAAVSCGIKKENVLFDHEGKPKSHLRAAVEGGCVIVARDAKEVDLIASFKASKTRVIVDMTDIQDEAALRKVVDQADAKKLQLIGVRCNTSCCTDRSQQELLLDRAFGFIEYLESSGHPVLLLDLGSKAGVGVSSWLDAKLFPQWPTIAVVADSSAWLLQSAVSVMLAVASVTVVNGVHSCSLSDGMYGAFSGLWKHPETKLKQPVVANKDPIRKLVSFKVLGNTECELDVLPGSFLLPEDLTVGDHLVFENVAALASNATFDAVAMNSSSESQIHAYIHSDFVKVAKELRCKEFKMPHVRQRTSSERSMDSVVLEAILQNLSLLERDEVPNSRQAQCLASTVRQLSISTLVHHPVESQLGAPVNLEFVDRNGSVLEEPAFTFL